MKPTHKSFQVNNLLDAILGASRVETIKSNRCAPAPIGCGKDIDPTTEFRDAVSKREYRISGLCQKCQDKLFGY